MADSRPGCVTGLGAVAAGLTLAAVLAIAAYAGQGMFSPGALNAEAATKPLGGARSHAELERACDSCHPAPWDSQTMADRCLVCHVDIGTQIGAVEGIHSRLSTASPGPRCSGCHPEHNGPSGTLTDIDEATFPHEVTGYSLKSHVRHEDGRRFVCKDCHPQNVTEFGEAICTECHTRLDARFMSGHLATWGRVCAPCHDGTGRNGAGFDHNKLPFKLDGAHVGVACAKCHANARSATDLQSTPRECLSCHRADDKHRGAFGSDCAACHVSASWAKVTFDHKVFPLDHGSEERQATCKTCHPRSTKTYDCYGCHEHTQAEVAQDHQGEVPATEDITNCIKCHKGGREADD